MIGTMIGIEESILSVCLVGVMENEGRKEVICVFGGKGGGTFGGTWVFSP